MIAAYILPTCLGVGSTLLFVAAALHPVFTKGANAQKYGDTAAHPEDLALRPKDHSFHALVALGFALMLSAYAFYAKIQLKAVVHDLHAVLNEQVPRVAEDISGIHGDVGRYFHGINASIAAVTAQSLGALGRVEALERYTRANAEGVKSQLAALMDGLNKTMANVDATLRG